MLIRAIYVIRGYRFQPLRMISFIVPAYNEELELSSTIAAIRAAAVDAPQPYEIIVVNDASTDATAEIAARAGARVVSISRRQIAASRNAGARAARGDSLFFVDADTRIKQTHIGEAIAALEEGYAGGSAWVMTDGFVPLWGRICVRVFCAVYFRLNLGAGAFLFTTRRNFDAIGGFRSEKTWALQSVARANSDFRPEIADVFSAVRSRPILVDHPPRPARRALAREA